MGADDVLILKSRQENRVRRERIVTEGYYVIARFGQVRIRVTANSSAEPRATLAQVIAVVERSLARMKTSLDGS